MVLGAALPRSSARTIDRQCASGLLAIATATKQVVVDRTDVAVARRGKLISLVQTPQLRVDTDPELLANEPDNYVPMVQTAEMVAKRH